ncbi:MAG: DinB family protein [Chloroflexi bacterium]|nr:DinB family protein [Chloroflexota bacterium]
METTTYIAAQIENAANLLKGLLSDVTEAEWRSRAAPGQNLFGFVAWHMVATQDWVVRVALQGLPMVASGPEWVARGVGICHVPFGMPAAEADALALATTPADVVAYSEAVLKHSIAWLTVAGPGALDAVPPGSNRTGYSEIAAYRQQCSHMEGWPAWDLFARPAIGHVRGHLGELDLVKTLLRG